MARNSKSEEQAVPQGIDPETGEVLEEEAATLRIEQVPLDKLYNHPANDYSVNEAELQDLMESIRREGIGQLPLVRPYKDGYQIIAGHRRKECYARLAKEDDFYLSMPVNVREDVDDDLASLLLETTNLMTRQMTPVERAKRFERVWNMVPELRKRDESLKGVRTSQVIADIITRETGQSVSRATVDRAMAAGKRAQEVAALVDSYGEQLQERWGNEARTRDGFTPDLVKELATRDGRVQEQLWADYQRDKLTPRQLAAMLEGDRTKTDVDAERILDRMIDQARELSAMKVKYGVAIDGYRLQYLKKQLAKLTKE